MSWLFEDSTPVLAVTAIIEIVLIFALIRSGERRFIYILIGVAAVCGLCVVIESVVETERERIEQAIEQTRQAVLTNKLEEVFRTIAPESRSLQSKAKRYLGQFFVRDIKITDGPHITVFTKTSPPAASVTIKARFDLEPKQGTLAYGSGFVRVKGRLIKGKTDWQWTEATFSSPLSR
jgi:hypothetical protein